MPAFLVFNDLSCAQIAPSFLKGTEYFCHFTNVVLDERIKGKKVLVTPSDFLQMQVNPAYSVGRLLKEYKGDDNDKRVRLKILVERRSTYSECLPSDELESQDSDSDYRFGDQPAKGLYVAFSLDGLSVSFLTTNQWDCGWLNLEKSWIDNTSVETRMLDVPHASRVEHLGEHLQWLQRNLPTPPSNGLTLWNERSLLFPSLDFCSSVEGQISELSGGEQRFKAILRGFQDLQSYCDSWTTPNFDIHRFCHASGESPSTLAMYCDERTFLCPDGKRRVFQWHLKRAGNRIHFFEFPETKRILVGYAGGHLRISSE